jgi:hypothetical protein
MDIPTNFDELVNHFQSEGEPESFNMENYCMPCSAILIYKNVFVL